MKEERQYEAMDRRGVMREARDVGHGPHGDGASRQESPLSRRMKLSNNPYGKEIGCRGGCYSQQGAHDDYLREYTAYVRAQDRQHGSTASISSDRSNLRQRRLCQRKNGALSHQEGASMVADRPVETDSTTRKHGVCGEKQEENTQQQRQQQQQQQQHSQRQHQRYHEGGNGRSQQRSSTGHNRANCDLDDLSEHNAYDLDCEWIVRPREMVLVEARRMMLVTCMGMMVSATPNMKASQMTWWCTWTVMAISWMMSMGCHSHMWPICTKLCDMVSRCYADDRGASSTA